MPLGSVGVTYMGNIISKRGWHVNDASFDWMYPEHIQQLSRRHWTPVGVARQSARFLANAPGVKILDIGSGVGKFTLIGAHHNPGAYFYGVEQRKALYEHAQSALAYTGIHNVSFIHGNFTQLDFDAFDHFYFYNAFFEHISPDGHIDQELEYAASLYHYYSRFLYRALDKKPGGTRLVTFHSLDEEIPPSYQLVDASGDFLLKMWIKR